MIFWIVDGSLIFKDLLSFAHSCANAYPLRRYRLAYIGSLKLLLVLFVGGSLIDILRFDVLGICLCEARPEMVGDLAPLYLLSS